MLKAKVAVKYRKGTKRERCLYCTNYVPEFECIGINNEVLGTQPRCKVIGLKPGRFYRVSSDHRCDEFADKFAAKS